MFKAEEIRALLTAKDFKPFVIHLSDGAHYEITNHDMVLVGRNDVHIGTGLDEVGIAERVVRCAILHITRIEDLQAAQQPVKKKFIVVGVEVTRLKSPLPKALIQSLLASSPAP